MMVRSKAFNLSGFKSSSVYLVLDGGKRERWNLNVQEPWRARSAQATR
jgi:hypothetical protein